MKTVTNSILASLEANKQKTAARLALIDTKIATVRNQSLAKLPAQYGFEDMQSFIRAVRFAGAGGKVNGTNGSKAQANGVRTRTKVTDDIRAQVKKLAGENKTGNEIAEAVGVSLPTVYNIKKALGLVQARK